MQIEACTTPTTVVNAQKSDYKRNGGINRRPPPPPPPLPSKTISPCRGCARTSHPNGKSMSRKDCPAYESTCHHCERKGHFKRACLTLKQQSAQSSSKISSAVTADTHTDYVSTIDANTSYMFATPDSPSVGHLEWDGIKF